MRKPKPEPVVLNVYDLALHNEMLAPLGLGFFHSGVEVHGVEYTFGGGGGIFSHPPRRPPSNPPASGGVPSGTPPFRAAVPMGTVEATHAEVARVVEGMRADWRGDSYSLLSNNCNSFAAELILRLTGQHIPGWVNRMSSIGRACSCLLPQQALADAAPRAPGGGSGGGGGGSNSSSRGGRGVTTLSGGVTLGGGSSGARGSAAVAAPSGGGGSLGMLPLRGAPAASAAGAARDPAAEAAARALRAEAASKRIAAAAATKG